MQGQIISYNQKDGVNMVVLSNLHNYEVIHVNSFDKIIKKINQNNVITFIDKKVSVLYPCLNTSTNIIITATQNIKTLQFISQQLTTLLQRNANSNTELLIIGGGTLQDSIGFLASIFHRGLKYTFIPTTLLSQTDSCIGGKTSINYKNNKNIIGSFYPPNQIMLYKQFIKTLSVLDFLSGTGQIYKLMILQGRISEFNLQNIEKQIFTSLKYKTLIIQKDQFDSGERKLLNFGHTFGHAFEITSQYIIPHGIAVVMGIIVSLFIGKHYNVYNSDYQLIIERGMQILHKSQITFKQKWFNGNQLINIILNDKKNTGKINMVIIDKFAKLMQISDHKILKQGAKQLCDYLIM